MNREAVSKRFLLSIGLALALAGADRPAWADVKLPAIFGSHMVLQREKKDRVWGHAEPGEEVTVRIAGQAKSTKAGPVGYWSVERRAGRLDGPGAVAVQPG